MLGRTSLSDISNLSLCFHTELNHLSSTCLLLSFISLIFPIFDKHQKKERKTRELPSWREDEIHCERKCVKVLLFFSQPHLSRANLFESLSFYRFPTHHHHFAIFILFASIFSEKPHEKHISLQNCFIDFSDKTSSFQINFLTNYLRKFLSRLIWGMK